MFAYRVSNSILQKYTESISKQKSDYIQIMTYGELKSICHAIGVLEHNRFGSTIAYQSKMEMIKNLTIYVVNSILGFDLKKYYHSKISMAK